MTDKMHNMGITLSLIFLFHSPSSSLSSSPSSSLSFSLCNSLNSTFMSFQASLARPPSHADLLASPSPSLLDTHTRLWVWLPIGYWGNQTGSQHYQKSVLDIAQVYTPCLHFTFKNAAKNLQKLCLSLGLPVIPDSKGLPQVGTSDSADAAQRNLTVHQPLLHLA